MKHVLVFFAVILTAMTAWGQTPAKTEGRILEIKGKLEIWKKESNSWVATATNQVVVPGDRLRTGEGSRATIELSNRSVLRMAELTTMEIDAPAAATSDKPTLDLKNGLIYFLSRDRPQQFKLRTRMATGAIRGTEFSWRVNEKETVLTMVEGEVELANAAGSVQLTSGEEATVALEKKPKKTAAINAINKIQWCLYYPGVLDVDELHLAKEERELLAASLQSWRAGDLPRAAENYPANRVPQSDSEKIYRAALFLSGGQVEKAEGLLTKTNSESDLATALWEVVASVRFQPWLRSAPPHLATEWLAESYYASSRSELQKSLDAAKTAVKQSPEFGFAWERVAELEFSFGHTKEALAALEKSLKFSPRNAQAVNLKGFLLSAEGKIAEAQDQFERAISIDPGLANPWLGRGLCRISRGQLNEGRKDLQIAAALEPNRALLRSYLGKAFSVEDDYKHALRELALAEKFDERDPTAYLYAALLKRQLNQINGAVEDLEKSKALNDNRSVFRSQLLLDQDQAVRSANLAAIYQEAGMIDVSSREAARALQSDYGNYSAHLFLANSYDALRDPRQITLRYETAWQSEYLLANLLAPAAAGALSPNISQQEYSKLLERDRLGFVSTTEFLSGGDWIEEGSQFGKFGNMAYSIDVSYRSENGQRPNNDFRQITVSPQFKQQIDEQNSLYLQATFYDATAGDVLQYYNQTNANPNLRTKERQDPLLLAGFHHEWSPGAHTLVLAGRLVDSFDVNNPTQPILVGTTNSSGTFTPLGGANTARLNYDSDLEIYTAELQQLLRNHRNSLIVGARFQTGDFDTRAVQTSPTALPFLFPGGVVSSNDFQNDFSRFSIYGYDNYQLMDSLLLTAGLSYDRLRFPQNFRNVPINNFEDDRDLVSPKAGIIWTPAEPVTVRGYYAKSLGGVSFDQSFRLEPVEIAGFTQTYRSLIPESLAGATSGAEFENWGGGVDWKVGAKTYLGVQGEILDSSVDQTIGAFSAKFAPPASSQINLAERLKYEERSLIFNANRLVGDEWALGLRDRLSQAELNGRHATSPSLDFHQSALLNQLSLSVFYNHRCGFFARAESIWSHQDNYSPALAGDDFWQCNLFVGYRILPRHAEFQIGLLNVTDQDYHLNPLNLYQDLPRGRTLSFRVKLSF